MPVDILYNEDLDTEWAIDGDIKKSVGIEQIRQSLGISVLESGYLTSPSFSPNDIEERREAIERAVRRNPLSREPIAVRVSDVDATASRIDFEIITDRVRFPVSAE
jgi:hypothetical protein